METQRFERAIHQEIVVEANQHAVWEAWTTEAGARTFFAPWCKIELRVGGPYEMYFNLNARPGDHGGEGLIILAFQPEQMLSVTWNAPPEMGALRGQHTHLLVRFIPLDEGHTRVILHHDGWGQGIEWDQVYEYFVLSWGKVVLPRLQRRFVSGPVDWNQL